MKKLILAILASCPLVATAAYYVDYSAGNDSAAGTSTGTAWKHLPGDPSATGNASSASGITGTIYLKGGVTYALSTLTGLTIDSSHYNNNGPVTFTSGTNVNNWGVGTSSIDGAGVASMLMTITINNATFRGLNMGNTIWDSSNDAAVLIDGCVSNVFDTCTVHDCGTNSSSAHCDGFGPHGNSPYASYHTITNCSIHDVTQKGIETYRAGHNTFVNNIIWNCTDHDIVCSSDGNRVYGNILSNACVPVWLCSQKAPGFGLKIDVGSTSGTSNGNLVYNNIFTHCPYGAISIDNVEGHTTGFCDNNLIANNTFIDIGSGGQYAGVFRIDVSGAGAVANGNVFVNNIVCSEQSAGSDSGGYLMPAALTTPYRSSATALGNNNIIAYNLFYGQNAAMHPNLSISGSVHSPTWANFADTGSTSPDYRFKVAANGSGNSFSFGTQLFDTDPKFTSYPGNLTLQGSSPARAAGTNLSAFFTTDINGVTRSAWSMGAYEYTGSGGSLLATPSRQDFGSITAGTTTNQTFTVRNSGSGTLSGTASVSPPFQVTSGGTYSLGANQSQLLTIAFAPTNSGIYNQTVTFTGGGGATATVSGEAPPTGLAVSGH
jgi:hypothetical protein